MLTLGSLFDGIGGWCLAAKHNGVKPVWSSEIEKFPLAVTRIRFPEVKQLGDVTKIDGAKIDPVDIVCAGSPCQDLSVANGNRKGLDGERSGLFVDSVRVVRSMQRATGGRYPRFFCWENVPGAYSSNAGNDFRTVLELLTEAEIPSPPGGKWANAGMVEWDGGQLAWRTINAEFYGVPQRRRRIFLVCDFRGYRAAEILFIESGLQGNFGKVGTQKKNIAGTFKTGAGDTSGHKNIAVGVDIYKGVINGDVACTLTAATGVANASGAKVLQTKNNPIIFEPGAASRLGGYIWENGIAPTLRAEPGDNLPAVAIDLYNGQITGGTTCSLTSRSGLPDATGPRIAYGIGRDAFNMGKNGKFGLSIEEDQQPPLTAKGPGAVATFREYGHGVWTEDNTGEALRAFSNRRENLVTDQKYVRRITPREAERLQGLPDDYTLIDDKSCSDSARYKALGNGMAQPCADWIIQRIVEVTEEDKKC